MVPNKINTLLQYVQGQFMFTQKLVDFFWGVLIFVQTLVS